jgi:hypothetical protein
VRQNLESKIIDLKETNNTLELELKEVTCLQEKTKLKLEYSLKEKEYLK